MLHVVIIAAAGYAQKQPDEILNAVVKVHILFRLSQQRWSNRGNQAAGFNFSWTGTIRSTMAAYLTVFYVCLLVLGTIIYTNALDLPSPLVVVKLLGWRF